MEFKEFTGKTVDDAITEACQHFMVASDRKKVKVDKNEFEEVN